MAYDPTSPWKKTAILQDKILDIMNDVFLEADPLDEIYEIPQEYNQRPNCMVLQNIGGFLQRETLTQ